MWTPSASTSWTASCCRPSSSASAAPVGLDNVAAAIGEVRDTIEDVIEPYLIQQGLLQRTPRGRMVTATTWEHFGLPVPSSDKAGD